MITISLIQEYLKRDDVKSFNILWDVIAVVCSNNNPDNNLTNLVVPIFMEEFDDWLSTRRDKIINDIFKC
jgi:hypothetical protein